MIDIPLTDRLERFLTGTWTGAKRIQGLQGGARAYVLALVAARARRPILVVASSARDAENLFDDLAFFLGEDRGLAPLGKRLHLFPSWEVLPFENLSPHPDNIAGRLEGLYKLVEDSAPILVATPAALMQRVIPKQALKQSYLYLVTGQDVSRESILDHLIQWGYQNVPLVEERGDFSARGGIVDLFSPGYRRPLRLEFDGDRLESMREFNPATQRTEQLQDEMLILPMKEFSLKRAGLEEALRRLDQRAVELEVDRREKNSLLESMRAGIPFPGIEFLAAYFFPQLVPVFSYLPAETLIWLDGADRIEAEAGRFSQLAWDRYEQGKEDHRLVARVEAEYLNEHEWRAALHAFPQVHGESLVIMAASERAQETTLTVETYLTTDARQETALHGKEASLKPLVEQFKTWETQKIIFVAPTKGDATRLRELLSNYDVQFTLTEEPAPTALGRSEFTHGIVSGHLTQGFRLP
ncbi:MAG TPA: hypothetical protein VGK57_13735, partial [Candidatus Binatia bacterium]